MTRVGSFRYALFYLPILSLPGSIYLSAMNILVMGVSGSGKTTIGRLLSDRLAIPFIDGDDLHPESNKIKQSKKIPLTDADRKPWLEAINQTFKDHQPKGCIIGSSALKEKYREIIKLGLDQVYWIVLLGDFNLIHDRMKDRKNHFMPIELLQSQFDTLEEPSYGLKIDISSGPRYNFS